MLQLVLLWSYSVTEKKAPMLLQMQTPAFTSAAPLLVVALSARCLCLPLCLNSCTPCAVAQPDVTRGQCL